MCSSSVGAEFANTTFTVNVVLRVLNATESAVALSSAVNVSVYSFNGCARLTGNAKK